MTACLPVCWVLGISENCTRNSCGIGTVSHTSMCTFFFCILLSFWWHPNFEQRWEERCFSQILQNTVCLKLVLDSWCVSHWNFVKPHLADSSVKHYSCCFVLQEAIYSLLGSDRCRTTIDCSNSDLFCSEFKEKNQQQNSVSFIEEKCHL